MMRGNQKQLCLVLVLTLAFAVPLSTTSDSQNPGSSGEGEEPLVAKDENTSDTPVGGVEVGAANASVVETNVTQVNDTAVGGNDTAAAASVPVSRPPPLRKIRCLKKRVVFNVSQVEEEAGSTLEEKSRRVTDQMDPKVRLVNATLLTQLFSEAYSPNVTNRSVAAQCHLVLFYAPWCPFSAAAAPHFNGLARSFFSTSVCIHF